MIATGAAPGAARGILVHERDLGVGGLVGSGGASQGAGGGGDSYCSCLVPSVQYLSFENESALSERFNIPAALLRRVV